MRLAHELLDLSEARVYSAYDMDTRACTDCGRCKKQPGCIFDADDATRFTSALKDADTLVVVSPIHFGSLTSETVRILSRLQTLYNGKHTRKDEIPTLNTLKVIVSAGADNDKMFEGARLTFNILKRLFEAEKAEFITLGNTDTLHSEASLAPQASSE